MSGTKIDPSRPIGEGKQHIKFMPKKAGFVAASDIPNAGVIAKIEGVHNNLKGIPNRVALRTNHFGNELLILSKGNARKLVKEIGSAESTDWIGEWVKIDIIIRQFNGSPVYGMWVILHYGHVAGKDGLIRGPRVAKY